jgi:hypothetical protein
VLWGFFAINEPALDAFVTFCRKEDSENLHSLFVSRNNTKRKEKTSFQKTFQFTADCIADMEL